MLSSWQRSVVDFIAMKLMSSEGKTRHAISLHESGDINDAAILQKKMRGNILIAHLGLIDPNVTSRRRFAWNVVWLEDTSKLKFQVKFYYFVRISR